MTGRSVENYGLREKRLEAGRPAGAVAVFWQMMHRV